MWSVLQIDCFRPLWRMENELWLCLIDLKFIYVRSLRLFFSHLTLIHRSPFGSRISLPVSLCCPFSLIDFLPSLSFRRCPLRRRIFFLCGSPFHFLYAIFCSVFDTQRCTKTCNSLAFLCYSSVALFSLSSCLLWHAFRCFSFFICLYYK